MTDDKCGNNDCDDEISTSSSTSVDTNEAFLELLGLPTSFNDSNISTTIEDADTCINGGDTIPCATLLEVVVPHRCSRYLHEPSDVVSFTIDYFLDASECQQIVHLATKLSSTGFHYVTEASHTDNDGVTHSVKLQQPNKHKLSVFEHTPTIDLLWKKMKPIILPHIGAFIQHTKCGPPIGLNPRLRVLRYDAMDDDIFEPHFDATTRVGSTTSLLTVLIYLNDGDGIDFDGGETCYLDHHVSSTGSSRSSSIDDTTTIKVVPTTGKVVIFEHDLYHSSVPLKFGTKYVLRTDVLFEFDANEGDVGVDIPRGSDWKIDEVEQHHTVVLCTTLLEVCQHIKLSDEDKQALDEIGLLDLTLAALFAPSVSAVRSMIYDAVSTEEAAEQLINATIRFRE